MSQDFLKSVLGNEGFKAVDRTILRIPILSSVVIPRTILAWVSTISKYGYVGELPGTPNSYFSLAKNSSDNFDGAITIQDKLYSLNNADLLHVASSVGVALNIETEEIPEQLKQSNLSKLGKSLDLLVKSQIIKQARQSQVEELPEPVLEVKKSELKPKSKRAPRKQGHSLKVSKTEAEKRCEECGGEHFFDSKFVGCVCLRDIFQDIRLEKKEDDYVLHFKPDTDPDILHTMIVAFKG